MAKLEPLGIVRIEALHYYVRDVARTRRLLTELLDFRETGGDDEALVKRTGQHTRVFQAGAVRLYVSEPLEKGCRAGRFLSRHPEGIGSVVFEVRDAARAFELLKARGGTPLSDVETTRADGGSFATFALATPFGDTTFRFIQRQKLTLPYPGFAASPSVAPGGNRYGFSEIDHVTSNFATMAPAALWLENVLGFEKFWEIDFHTNDVAPDASGGSGLRSIVHKDPSSPVKFADNEPLRPNYRKSQIHLFRVDHGGDGVQHAAIAAPDLVTTVGALKKQGAPFLKTPGAYYDALPERMRKATVGKIDESIDVLRELGILVDGDKPGKYLLQIFMDDMATVHKDPTAGPFFFELIQRKGDDGFGYGNFRALFESIERTQQAQGRV